VTLEQEVVVIGSFSNKSENEGEKKERAYIEKIQVGRRQMTR
jgi:hypothetical protein